MVAWRSRPRRDRHGVLGRTEDYALLGLELRAGTGRASASGIVATRRRQHNWKSTELPELMFPADRPGLVSSLWDDDWTCIGGSATLGGRLLTRRQTQALHRSPNATH